MTTISSLDSSRQFREYTQHDAPPSARQGLDAAHKRFGKIPAPLQRYAVAPVVLAAAQQALGAFEQTSLTPLEREVLAMTVSRRNGCEYCLALHEKLLGMLAAPSALIVALRNGSALDSPRFEALRTFIEAALLTSGDVDDETWQAFLNADYTREQALEVILGISAYTLTTFANRLTQAPLD